MKKKLRFHQKSGSHLPFTIYFAFHISRNLSSWKKWFTAGFRYSLVRNAENSTSNRISHSSLTECRLRKMLRYTVFCYTGWSEKNELTAYTWPQMYPMYPTYLPRLLQMFYNTTNIYAGKRSDFRSGSDEYVLGGNLLLGSVSLVHWHFIRPRDTTKALNLRDLTKTSVMCTDF